MEACCEGPFGRAGPLTIERICHIAPGQCHWRIGTPQPHLRKKRGISPMFLCCTFAQALLHCPKNSLKTDALFFSPNFFFPLLSPLPSTQRQLLRDNSDGLHCKIVEGKPNSNPARGGRCDDEPIRTIQFLHKNHGDLENTLELPCARAIHHQADITCDLDRGDTADL